MAALLPLSSSVVPPATPVAAAASDDAMIASNFTTFLQLLTTQLKNQNPLDPLDTNQFTQQLVQFAQVEQQMKSNDQLKTLISIEQSAQATVALTYVGQTVVVDGSAAQLTNAGATWVLNVAKPSTATVTIKDSTGQTAYTGTFAMNPGTQSFVWDGKGNDGKTWPPGNYTMTRNGDRRQWPNDRSVDGNPGGGGLGRPAPRIRRSCRSTVRPTRWTRSSAWCGRPERLA